MGTRYLNLNKQTKPKGSVSVQSPWSGAAISQLPVTIAKHLPSGRGRQGGENAAVWSCVHTWNQRAQIHNRINSS